MKIGSSLLGLLAGLSLLSASSGDPPALVASTLEWIGFSHTGSPVLYADAAPPVLTSALPAGIKVALTVTHPTATEFHIRIISQDEGISAPTTGFINRPPWRRIG